MKNLILLVSLLAALALVSGCKNDDSSTNPEDTVSLTVDDAADAFASALGGSAGTGGLTAQLEEAAAIAGGGSLGKTGQAYGILFDTTITRQRVGTYSYSYTFHYSFGIANANQFDFSYTMKGTYETPRMTSSDSAAATLQVSNLLTGQAYSVTGIYNRYGTQVSKVRNWARFSSTITFSFTALEVDKATKRISGGTATLSMSGQTEAGRIFAYTATVTFLGNHQATLIIGGKTYTGNLVLGEATAA